MENNRIEHTTNSPKETKLFTKKLLELLAKKHSKKTALIIALSGDLGAGKTNFTQGVKDVFGITKNITSPTFVIMKRYQIKNKETKFLRRAFSNVYHFDCYRVHSPEELLDLGWEDIIKNPENIVFVEWGERIKDIMPNNCAWVTIDNIDQTTRKIIVDY